MGGTGTSGVGVCEMAFNQLTYSMFNRGILMSGSCLGPLSPLSMQGGIDMTNLVLGSDFSKRSLAELQMLPLDKFPSL